jgi:leader peptidase (prepilin peptidase)/N-methyltransferase
VYCLAVAGLIVATFVDWEHTIIPDQITIGGTVAGIVCSFFVPCLHSTFPSMQRLTHPGAALYVSIFGAAFGALVFYAIVRLGKLAFGRKILEIEPGAPIRFTETALRTPIGNIEYEEIFYRESDTIVVEARRVELTDRCYRNTTVRLNPKRLEIGGDHFIPEDVAYMEAIAEKVVLPREAMGMGDVKFMAAIGAFLGWPAVCFILAASSLIGSIVGLAMIALKKRERSSEIPFGPYIAVAALLWMFFGRHWTILWLRWMVPA